MPENKFVENADNVYFESVEDEDGLNLNLEADLKTNLAGLVEARHAAAESARDTDESRWITAYHNFRGIYPKNVRFRESERSRVFIKITKHGFLKLNNKELIVKKILVLIK